MARQATEERFLNIALIIGGAYITYELARNNKLGAVALDIALEIEKLFAADIGGKRDKDKEKDKDKRQEADFSTCTPGTGNLSWMVQSDPNFIAHVRGWQAEVAPNQKYNWEAFRGHEMAITAAPGWSGFDPGTNPPRGFCTGVW